MVVHPGEQKESGRPYCCFSTLEEGYKKDGETLFAKACSDRIRVML